MPFLAYPFPQVNIQMSVLRLGLESSNCMKGALFELDDVSRERHDEVCLLSQTSENERKVRRADNFSYGVLNVRCCSSC
jgi:hypothetical protein